jgi:hypothetical protein
LLKFTLGILVKFFVSPDIISLLNPFTKCIYNCLFSSLGSSLKVAGIGVLVLFLLKESNTPLPNNSSISVFLSNIPVSDGCILSFNCTRNLSKLEVTTNGRVS